MSTKIEIVFDEEGVDFSVLKNGRRSVHTDLAMLQLDVSTSGMRVIFNDLNDQGKKRQEAMLQQAGVMELQQPAGLEGADHGYGRYI